MMSREIKFRAWEPDTKKMVDVYGVNPIVKKAYLSHQQLFGTAGDDLLLSYRPDEEYSYVRLMQYTGLKDKNGVEIYEGDIVDDYYFKNSVSRHKVYWADSYGCWSTVGLKDPIVDRKQLAYFNEAKNLHRNEYLEVIGNIYENQELLKDEYGE